VKTPRVKDASVEFVRITDRMSVHGKRCLQQGRLPAQFQGRVIVPLPPSRSGPCAMRSSVEFIQAMRSKVQVEEAPFRVVAAVRPIGQLLKRSKGGGG
jgi:hypothetical protein